MGITQLSINERWNYNNGNQAWEPMPLVPALWRQKQVNLSELVLLAVPGQSRIVRTCLKNNQKRKMWYGAGEMAHR